MTDIRAADHPAPRPAAEQAAARRTGVRSRGTTRRGLRTGTAARPSLTLWQRIKRDKVMLALMLPGFLYFAVFSYAPLFGYLAAFEDYQPYTGFLHSTWLGLQNFTDLFADTAFWTALTNTFVISLIQLVLFFPAPIGLALLLNSAARELGPQVRAERRLPAALHRLGGIVSGCPVQVLGPTGTVSSMMTHGGRHVVSTSSATRPGSSGWC